MFPPRNTKRFIRILEFSDEILDISKPENINVLFLKSGIQRSHYFWGFEIGLLKLVLSNSSSILDAYELKRRIFAEKYCEDKVSPHFIVIIDNRTEMRQEVFIHRMTDKQRFMCQLPWCDSSY